MNVRHAVAVMLILCGLVIAAAVASAELSDPRARPLGPGAFLSVVVPLDGFDECEALAPGLAEALAGSMRQPVRVDCFRRAPDHAPDNPSGGTVKRPLDVPARRSGDLSREV